MSRPLITLLLAVAVLAAPAAALAQAHTVSATPPDAMILGDLSADLGAAAEKLIGLAEAMPEEVYAWRPAEGVRSVHEVLRHVAAANYGMPTLMGAEVPEGVDLGSDADARAAYERSGTKEEVVASLRDSFDYLQALITTLPDERLDDEITYFGRQGTVQSLLVLMTTHVHEHLGQTIAYARMNGVTPPWSAQ